MRSFTSRCLLRAVLVCLCAWHLPGSAASIAEEVAQLPTSFARCPEFFVQRQAPAIARNPRLRELCYDSFAVLHSGVTKTLIFAAQRLSSRALGGIKRQKSDRFFADARLPRAERPELEDYKRSGYSRGHLAPSGDMTTELALAQSYPLANMVPQSIRHNSGAWSKIEQDTRKYVQRAQGDVYVITGAVFNASDPQIGDNEVHVPSYMFKLVYDSHTRQAWAHWHANRDEEVASNPISYKELVKRTGIHWLPPGATRP